MYRGSFRWGSAHYRVNGTQFVFYDERLYPQGQHDQSESVNVPGKTAWIHCASSPSYFQSIWGWHTPVHMGGINVSFLDGHGKTYSAGPLNDHWLATGGFIRSAAEPFRVRLRMRIPTPLRPTTIPPKLSSGRYLGTLMSPPDIAVEADFSTRR